MSSLYRILCVYTLNIASYNVPPTIYLTTADNTKKNSITLILKSASLLKLNEKYFNNIYTYSYLYIFFYLSSLISLFIPNAFIPKFSFKNLFRTRILLNQSSQRGEKTPQLNYSSAQYKRCNNYASEKNHLEFSSQSRKHNSLNKIIYVRDPL